jgi:FPC/CPF motif-containing protein YcgG
MGSESIHITNEFLAYLSNKNFPCIGAKAAVAKNQMHCLVVEHMACPADDLKILEFIYKFVDSFRQSADHFNSVAIIFKGPEIQTEEEFETLFWKRLQSLADMDAKRYPYDTRVEKNPQSANFSFSLKEEALFVIGLHPAQKRASRKFRLPALVFNPHAQFETLRSKNKYESMKKIVRKHELNHQGSINPMLDDFGNSSETFQYSGKQYDAAWQCPLIIRHSNDSNNTAT